MTTPNAIQDIDLIPIDMQNTESTQTNHDSDAVILQRNLFSQAFWIMDEMRQSGQLCDVVLKVEDKSFNAHRIILSASIPYFRAMFSLDMRESKQKEIELHGLNAITVETFINYAYTGKMTLDVNNVKQVMSAATFFQMNFIKNACEEFLQVRLNVHNVIGIRTFADALDCKKLKKSADEYISEYFNDISCGKEYLSCSNNDILEMLKKDDLNVSSEEQVFEALMRWIKNDEAERTIFLPNLLPAVRLPLLTPHYIADVVSNEISIRSSHECRDLLDEARDFHLMPERRSQVESYKSQSRIGNNTIGYIFAVGGLTKSGDSLSTVEVYNPSTGRWVMAEAMSMLRSRVGVAVMRNCLFAVGGYNGYERLSTVEVYDPIINVWNRVASMKHDRSAVGAAVLNDRLFVCGGFDGVSSLNTVECYHADTDRWHLISGMQKRRSACGVIAFNGYIYAIGGHDGMSIFDSVERYDPSTDTWTMTTPMITKRCRLGVAVLNNKLYVCGGYDGASFLQTVEVYNPHCDKWSFVKPMNVMRSRVALVSNMGKLWAIGGYDGLTNLSTMESYDPNSNTWMFMSDMCAHEGGVGAGVIPIYKNQKILPNKT